MTSVNSQRRRCQSCAGELELPGSDRRWTQCPVCYWKERVVPRSTMEDWQRRRAEIQSRMQILMTAVPQAKAAFEQASAQFRARPWYRRLSGATADETLQLQVKQYQALRREDRELRSDLRIVENRISASKSIIRKLANAEAARDRRVRRELIENERRLAQAAVRGRA